MTHAVSVSHFESFASLPGDAAALLDAATAFNPFVSAPWLRTFERRLLRAGEAPLYAVATCDGRPGVVLPLLVERRPGLGVVKVRAMSNFYTGIYGAVAGDAVAGDDAAQHGVVAALARSLAERFRGMALLEFRPLRSREDSVAALGDAFAGRGFATRRYPVHANWFESVDGGDFDGYLARRPGRLRSTIARKRSRLQRERTMSLVTATQPEELQARFPDFERVYAASWKSAEHSPIFIREVMTALAGRGLARLCVLYVDDVPAAAQIWVRIGPDWAVFKLAYDPEFGRYSVGTVLMADAIEGFFEAGPFGGLDFLSGDDAYKRDWASERREHWGFEALSGRSVLGRLLRLKRRVAGIRLLDESRERTSPD